MHPTCPSPPQQGTGNSDNGSRDSGRPLTRARQALRQPGGPRAGRKRGPAWGRGRQQSRGARGQDRSRAAAPARPRPPGGDVTGGRAEVGGAALDDPGARSPKPVGLQGRAGSEGRGRPKAPPTRSSSGYPSSAAGSGYFGLVSAGSGGSWALPPGRGYRPVRRGSRRGHLRPPSAAWLCHVPRPIPQTLFRPKGQRWD